MKRARYIGVILVLIGWTIFSIKSFVKMDQISEFLDITRRFGAAAFIIAGCYFLYRAKKAQSKKEDQA